MQTFFFILLSWFFEPQQGCKESIMTVNHKQLTLAKRELHMCEQKCKIYPQAVQSGSHAN